MRAEEVWELNGEEAAHDPRLRAATTAPTGPPPAGDAVPGRLKLRAHKGGRDVIGEGDSFFFFFFSSAASLLL